MNRHALEVLEFDRLLAVIAGYVQGAGGRRVILGLSPSTDLQQIKSRRGLYTEMLQLLESPRSLPALHLDDISDILLRAAPADAILDGEALVQCRSQLGVVQGVADYFAEPELRACEHLERLASRLSPCQDFRRQLERCLDADGTLFDSASDTLRELRRGVAAAERRIQRVLDDMLKSSTLDNVIQERFVTLRNGRFVVPVRRDARGQFPGLVHDLSSSGQTVFIEPQATVELGNELNALRAQERHEIRKILGRLTAELRERLDLLRANQEVLAELDAAAAVGRWAADYGCHLPTFGAYLKLQQARHPLLLEQFRREGKGRRVVPLDFAVPRGARALVVTGSNTGGKTVVLKTLGLLALAAQSGLPVPVAEESLFPVFQDILADIGDEQSLQENLSTFSAHMGHITRILKTAGQGRCLVLLDELGSGTDPLEGGAIACGILEELVSVSALAIATTHLGMVKNYVHEHPTMVNASVRFNLDTLAPEYVLDIGRPGASYAMQIARGLGLPEAVLARAAGLLSGDHQRIEDMLARLEADQRRLASQAEQATQARQESERDRAALKEELAALRAERKQLLHEANRQAAALVDNARRDLENSLRTIREKAASPAAAAEVDEAVKSARALLAAKAKNYQEGEQRHRRLAAPLPRQVLAPGRKVWIEKLQAHGRIDSVGATGGKVVVRVNDIPFTMAIADLQGTREPDDGPPPPQASAIKPRFEGQTAHEIILLGCRVDEALARLDAYLSRCQLAGLQEVRIVHGFGTGQLKQGIHAWLRQQRHIKGFRLGRDFEDPGGGGVTIVTL